MDPAEISRISRAAFTDVSGGPLTAPIWITASLGNWPPAIAGLDRRRIPREAQDSVSGISLPGWSSPAARENCLPILRLERSRGRGAKVTLGGRRRLPGGENPTRAI